MPHEPNSETVPAGSPLLTRAYDAFYRDLRELLKTQKGKWVAYHGDRLLGSGRTQTELYRRCLSLGLPEEEFEVLFVDHQALYDREEMELPEDR